MKNQYVAPKTIEQAIKECEPSINKLVTKWTRNHYQDRNDFVQMAYEGIMMAWAKYDKRSTNKFSTYAHWYIMWKVREGALKHWDNKNNECEYKVELGEEPLTNMKDVEMEMQLEKRGDKFKAIFEAREAGYTFTEIATEFGFKNLHKARNYYLEEVKSIEL